MKNKFNPTDFGKVVVLMGGFSVEREISLANGKRILEALVHNKIKAHGLDVSDNLIQKLLALKPDYAFIALHDSGSKDGTIQGVLQYLGIPYTGSGIIGSAVTREKSFAKLIWQRVGVPTPQFRLVADMEAAINVMVDFGFPLCVKSADADTPGTSTCILESEQLPDAYKTATTLGDVVMVEPWLEGIHYSVTILGNTPLPVVEIQTEGVSANTGRATFELAKRYLCPSNLSEERQKEIQALAFRAFQVLGCTGWGSVNLVEDYNGDLWVLDINTVPDLSETGPVSIAANTFGLSFDQLVLEILNQTLRAEKDLMKLAA
jgi:D-alanine-D-alanine ligase